MATTAAKAKVAIITGASSGIGRMSAIALCEAGWDVILSARRQIELEETARLCTEARVAARASGETGKVALAVVGDVTKEEDVKALFECGVAEYGRIDLLFNVGTTSIHPNNLLHILCVSIQALLTDPLQNAGISGTPGPLETLPISNYTSVLTTNVVASILCTQYAMRQFKSQSPQGGRIINNGSLAAHVPRPLGAAYAISKHAVLGLTKCTSLEGRKFGIACTQIDVGNAMTDMGAHATTGALQPDGSMRKEPAIEAKHVGSSIVHIASLPLDVTVLEMNIMATEMPYVGRG